jgi:hypothetical protein
LVLAFAPAFVALGPLTLRSATPPSSKLPRLKPYKLHGKSFLNTSSPHPTPPLRLVKRSFLKLGKFGV